MTLRKFLRLTTAIAAIAATAAVAQTQSAKPAAKPAAAAKTGTGSTLRSGRSSPVISPSQ